MKGLAVLSDDLTGAMEAGLKLKKKGYRKKQYSARTPFVESAERMKP